MLVVKLLSRLKNIQNESMLFVKKNCDLPTISYFKTVHCLRIILLLLEGILVYISIIVWRKRKGRTFHPDEPTKNCSQSTTELSVQTNYNNQTEEDQFEITTETFLTTLLNVPDFNFV